MKVKMLFALSVITSAIVVSGSTNSVGKADVSNIIARQKNGMEENFLARLNRLDFNASAKDEDTIRISISGGDVPLYVSAKAARDISGNVYYTAYKIYGKWFIPRSKQSLKLLHTRETQERGWQLLPVDGECVVMYLHKIRNDVSDNNLVDAILSVSRIKMDQFPIGIDDEYQKRWSAYLLGAIIFIQEDEDMKALNECKDLASYCRHTPFNQDNYDKTITLINSLDKCPEDLKQAAKDYVDAQVRLVRWSRDLVNRKPDTSIEDAADIGAGLGALNEDNPIGGALLGGFLGALIGAAHQEEQRETLKSEHESLKAVVLEKREKFMESVKRNVDLDKIKRDQESGRAPIRDINEK